MKGQKTGGRQAGTPNKKTAEVAELVRLCGAFDVPIVPRGAGTGLSGGAAGIEGALTIAFTRMTRIIEIDRGNLTVTAQPGVINADLKATHTYGRDTTVRPVTSTAAATSTITSALPTMWRARFCSPLPR